MKTYKLFIYGDTHYTANSLGILRCELHIYTFSLLLSVHLYYKGCTEMYTGKNVHITIRIPILPAFCVLNFHVACMQSTICQVVRAT